MCRLFHKLDEALYNRSPPVLLVLVGNPISTEVQIELYSMDEHPLDEVMCDADVEEAAMSCIAIKETLGEALDEVENRKERLAETPSVAEALKFSFIER